jgi:hypothetical protein
MKCHECGRPRPEIALPEPKNAITHCAECNVPFSLDEISALFSEANMMDSNAARCTRVSPYDRRRPDRIKQVKRGLGSSLPCNAKQIGWEQVVAVDLNDGSAPPGVRRMAVPSGWLYQVEHCDVVDGDGSHILSVWHPPIFVPNRQLP